MRTSRHLLPLALTACVATACLAQAKREPHIGYIYPGGGKQGATFEVTVGGQLLRGAKDVIVSGEGVHAKIILHHRPRRNLMKVQRDELIRRLRVLWQKRIAEMPGKVDRRLLRLPGVRFPKMGMTMTMQAQKKNEPATPAVELPNHPLLRDLESKSLRELWHVADTFLSYRRLQKMQLNTQLAELLLLEVTIDPGAAPGDRELRINARFGLTNPMCFQVGTLPEVCEQEPNDPKTFDPLPKEPALNLPVVLNGQIMPGDVDRFHFRAKRGQQLVIETYARHLVPFLADAVPGWFQATVALYDAKGREVAFTDDYRFRPDPVLFYEIPGDGEYELEIRDAIYRGREDFVYRVAVGELPFITQMFPLGGQAGAGVVASIDGWHLPAKELSLDTRPGIDRIRRTTLRQDGRLSNEVAYAVDTLPECNETEPNDNRQKAQRIDLPRIINGRIARPGDVDVFRFEGRAGDKVVADVQARRLYSPLDSLLRVTNAEGKVLEWNDDHMLKEGHLHPDMGTLTHHADSYLTARLPKDGTYYVHLSDAENHGGDAYAYRLRISPPQVDFALRVIPSSLSVLAGRSALLTAHVLRKDGFGGAVDLTLKDPPAGFVLTGGRIPRGRDSVRMTLMTPRKPVEKPVTLHLQGSAQVGGKTVTRPVVPSDDVMQAFLYRHLVPSDALMVAVTKTRWAPPPIKLANRTPLQVPAGGATEMRIDMTQYLKSRKIELKLNDPPKGVTLGPRKDVPDGIAFPLRADGKEVKPGFADNLIVEAIMEVKWKPKGKKGGKAAKARTRRVSLGILPAIPFEVIQP